MGDCAPSTKCGPIHIPEHHLQVHTHTHTHTLTHSHSQPCRSCQANNCTEESSVGEGSAGVAEGSVGVAGADVVVYVSTVSDGNKCCTFFT